MGTKETYYGAFIDYRKHTQQQKDCTRQRKQIYKANQDADRIEVVKTECEVEDDWIEAIEKGLDFIDKAIKEERQFILSNGEVVPIEKVKNVSKESVEHLAKHSNLLTRLPKEGRNLIPDKLYTVERLTDYAVYENRFLYMLLCYLRDFISRRYNELVELTTTYSGKLQVKKHIVSVERDSVIEIILDERLKNDGFLKENNSAREKILKIDGLLKGVVSFLAHPLMEEVSNAPLLKPPITETNVLKMDKHFKGAMQLYYFITAYDKPGYTVNRTMQVLSPFKEGVGDEFAEVIDLCSFLTYEHGMGIEDIFKESYDRQLKLEQEAEQKKKLEQLSALRRRIRENGGDAEEYMLLLEQRNRLLEADSVELLHAKTEIKAHLEKIDILTEKVDDLHTTIDGQQQLIDEKQAEIERMMVEHEEEIQRLTAEYEDRIQTLTDDYERALHQLQEECEETVATIQRECKETVSSTQQECEDKIASTIEEYQQKEQTYIAEYDCKIQSLIAECEQAIAAQRIEYESLESSLTEKLLNSQSECEELQGKLNASVRQAYVAEARVNAIKKESGLYTGEENYNSESGFNELERQYNHFKALFKEQWKLTKKAIRKQYLKATIDESFRKKVAVNTEHHENEFLKSIAVEETDNEESVEPVAVEETDKNEPNKSISVEIHSSDKQAKQTDVEA